MREDSMFEILRGYGIQEPQLQFLRHNENRTYEVIDSATGEHYLFRVHQPLTRNFEGLQQTDKGLLTELQLLEELGQRSELIAQKPVWHGSGNLLTHIEHEGKRIPSSLLTWVEGAVFRKETCESDPVIARELGAHIASLHRFFRSYHPQFDFDSRPSQGIERNSLMIAQIHRGVEQGLFGEEEFRCVEQTIGLVNSRLESLGKSEETYGIIHGDLNMSNIILTPEGEICFIDFGLCGSGYYLFDVGMGTLVVPPEQRLDFLAGYYGDSGDVPDTVRVLLEGWMLIAVLGYYAFQMENQAVHPWIRERMPGFCTNLCRPYLSGERVMERFKV
ncbi:phosphotransferase enzyme family protein [Paenibacillus lignilyticus]|uniref:Aminoglycoside phosphotransferase family protein n=1 Tax=Paenibacillus lignilyticus TaxID=1172615 RepID=A0ABS5C7A6_9BACL|nr:aminoglycoside phosphotransferase family protein [Paenibacillus lignilyticus]MBP3961881.1 aminoglycoside phosphotransferase family protein [Paenibacillus lignilyticus]